MNADRMRAEESEKRPLVLNDRDEPAAAGRMELHEAAGRGEQRVVSAAGHAGSRMDLGPRWRTMIEPAGTVCPEKLFTPSRFDLESRPLRDDPPPFLCAIS